MNPHSVFQRPLLALTLAAAATASHAHIGYGSGDPLSSTSRNFGNVSAGYLGTFAGRTVTSNFGWADASDMNLAFDASFATTRAATSDASGWAAGGFGTDVDNLYFGDSHKGTAFRFRLDGTTTLSITLSGATGVTGATGGALTPGFSLYMGLAALSPFSGTQTSADYDFSAASRDQRSSWAQSTLGAGFGYLATQGNWNALGNWYSGGDGDPNGNLSQLSLFQYLGSAYSTTTGGTASASFTLGAGDYTIYLGGNDLQSKDVTNSGLRYGFNMTVSAVPEAETWALMLLGLSALAVRRRAAAR